MSKKINKALDYSEKVNFLGAHTLNLKMCPYRCNLIMEIVNHKI